MRLDEAVVAEELTGVMGTLEDYLNAIRNLLATQEE